jgi:hypothetical protein
MLGPAGLWDALQQEDVEEVWADSAVQDSWVSETNNLNSDQISETTSLTINTDAQPKEEELADNSV